MLGIFTIIRWILLFLLLQGISSADLSATFFPLLRRHFNAAQSIILISLSNQIIKSSLNLPFKSLTHLKIGYAVFMTSLFHFSTKF